VPIWKENLFFIRKCIFPLHTILSNKASAFSHQASIKQVVLKCKIGNFCPVILPEWSVKHSGYSVIHSEYAVKHYLVGKFTIWLVNSFWVRNFTIWGASKNRLLFSRSASEFPAHEGKFIVPKGQSIYS
jgi:hypothetical protein